VALDSSEEWDTLVEAYCLEGVRAPDEQERGQQMSEAVKRYRVWWDDEEKVMRIEWLPGSVAGLAEAKAVAAEMRALRQEPVPLFVDMREMAKFERPAREHFTSQHHMVTAIALVAGSPVTKMMANFFIGMRRMPVPMQMFTDEAEALTWLQGFR
jgi:hypothetical protein